MKQTIQQLLKKQRGTSMKKQEPNRKCKRCGKLCWGKTCWECFSKNNNRVAMWRNRWSKK